MRLSQQLSHSGNEYPLWMQKKIGSLKETFGFYNMSPPANSDTACDDLFRCAVAVFHEPAVWGPRLGARLDLPEDIAPIIS